MDILKFIPSCYKKILCFRYQLFLPILIGLLLYSFIDKEIFKFSAVFNSMLTMIALEKYQHLSWVFCFLSIITICTIITIVWYLSFIRIPRFDRNKFGILIVMSSKDTDGYDALERIYRAIVSFLNTYECIADMEVKKARLNLVLQNAEDKGLCFKNSRAKMIISSELLIGKDKKGVEVNRFPDIFFILNNISSLSMPDKKEVFSGLKTASLEYPFRDLNAEQELGEAVAIRSMILMANAVRCHNQYDKAEWIIKDITKKYPSLNQSSVIRNNIAICRFAKAAALYNRNNKFKASCDILCAVDSLLDSSIAFYERYDARVLQAIVNFAMGRIKKTKTAIKRLLSFRSNNPIANLDLSFIYAYEGNIKECDRVITKLLFNGLSMNQFDFFHSVEFTLATLEKDNSRYHLYFYLARLYEINSLNESLIYMNFFLNNAKNNGDIASINIAKENIAIINSKINDAKTQEPQINVPTEKLSK